MKANTASRKKEMKGGKKCHGEQDPYVGVELERNENQFGISQKVNVLQ